MHVDPVEQLLVRQALESLSPSHREVLFLVDVMGLRYGEVSELLDVPEGTVMSRISRARRSMIDALDGSNVTQIKPRLAGRS